MEIENPIDLRRLLYQYLIGPWYMYVVGLALCLATAWVYLRYTPRQFQAKTTLLLKTPDAVNEGVQESFLLGDVGSLVSYNNIENEIQVLRSRTLMREVVERLQLYIRYEEEGRITTGERYLRSALLVDSFSLSPETKTAMLRLQATGAGDYEVWSREQMLGRVYPGETLSCKFGAFRFKRNPEARSADGDVIITFLKPEDMAIAYSGKVTAKRVGEYSAVLELSLKDKVPEKAADILNTLTQVYNERSIGDKNQVWKNTYTFIQDRLQYLTAELSDAENAVQRFKTSHGVTTGMEENVKIALENLRANDRELTEISLRLTLLDDIRNNLQQIDARFDLLPVNISADQAELSQLVGQFNTLVQERKRLLNTLTPEHISVRTLDSQLFGLRDMLQTTLKNMAADLRKNEAVLQSKSEVILREMRTLPSVERQLIEITRTKNIKENLYLFLLEKREEAALNMAIALADARVIDPAISPQKPVYPNAPLTYALALLLGLSLPLGLVFLLQMLDTTLKSEEDIRAGTQAPCLGSIAFSRTGKHLVVKHHSRSAVSEMFRLLRANLQFVMPGREPLCLLITSGASGEGKSFITLNLGMTYALAGKKTVLISLDLRKPKLSSYLEAEDIAMGITQMLIGAAEPEQIIRPSRYHENLFFIPSGPIPPNPAELLLNEQMPALFEHLKNTFDVILVDTPPVGLVSDALLLKRFADATLFITRFGQTPRAVLATAEALYENEKLPRLNLLLNGVKAKARYGYGKGYYGYGYGYYDEDNKG